MNLRDEDPARWREASADPRALPARAADLVDAVRGVSPLPPEALARIKTGVLTRRPARGAPLVLRLALMTGFVFASVATARGTMILWRRFVVPPTRVEATAPRHVAVKAPAKVAPIVVEELDEAAPVAPPAVVAPVRAHKSAAPKRPASDEAVPDAPEAPASTAKDEAELLARAISRLRQARDPRGALALLDQYQRSFPHGVMEPEALRARLEAVIQMDDRKTALALLDERRAFAGRMGAELLLTRAELRASAGRYTDAVADFDAVLGTTGSADVTGRALYGRAISLGHLGLDARARADLAAYQGRFPDGKFATEVARLLKDGNHP